MHSRDKISNDSLNTSRTGINCQKSFRDTVANNNNNKPKHSSNKPTASDRAETLVTVKDVAQNENNSNNFNHDHQNSTRSANNDCNADISDDEEEECPTEQRKKRYHQKVRYTWLKHPLLKHWININENDQHYVRCKYCGCAVQCKLSILKKHASSKKHVKNAEPFSQPQQKIDFSTKNNPTVQLARTWEARHSLFVACHSTINVVSHLTECQKCVYKNEPISSEISLGRTKCTAIIKNIWGPHFKQNLKADIGQSAFSLIIDEATDISNVKYIGIVIKYFSTTREEITTTFLALEECEDSTANGITEVLKRVLDDFDLSVDRMSGLGTDNASVMVGSRNSVYMKLQNMKQNKNLILVPCACHSLQLAVVHAVSKNFPPDLEYISNETFAWFSKSPKRQLMYKNIYRAINDGVDPLKITKACPTRWMSIEQTIRRICAQWLELKTHFGIVTVSEKCYTAKVLYNLYKDETLFLMATFLKTILKETQAANKALQAKQSDPTKILNDLYFLIQSIAGQIYIKEKIIEIVSPSSDYSEFDYSEFLLPRPYLGYEFESILKQKIESNQISDDQEHLIRSTCINFMKDMVVQLRKRLPKNIQILNQISKFSINNALKQVKDPIVDILEIMGISFSEIDCIQAQWNRITQQQWDINLNTTSFWIQVYKFKNSVGENPFRNISEFVLSLLVLPFSNADVERLFSTMGLVKTKLRNKMRTSLLCSIIYIREGFKANNVCCQSYEVSNNIIHKVGSSEKYFSNSDECEIEDILEDFSNL